VFSDAVAVVARPGLRFGGVASLVYNLCGPSGFETESIEAGVAFLGAACEAFGKDFLIL
jgi:hypothetical protein